MSSCRAGCPHPAASIGVLSYVDGAMWASPPTTPQATFPRTCRGRRSRRPASAGCPPRARLSPAGRDVAARRQRGGRALPRAMRSQRRQAPAPTGLAKRSRSCRRAGCTPRAFVTLRSTGTLTPPRLPKNSRILRGGAHGPRPTTPQAAFPNCY